MSWQVALYKLERLDGQSLAHSDRGKIKNILWELYKKKKSQCRGLGFVVDIAPDLAAVPIGWNLPSPEEFEDYAVYRQEEVQVSLANPRHHKIVVGLIREGLKRHFKNNNPAELGPLWQDYGRFCQQPQDDGESNASFCRRFDFGVKILRGQRVVIEFPITTTAVDNFSFADYYQNGEVDLLAEMIETKRADRVTRQNQPIATRVARYLPHPNNVIQEVLDLSQEATIFDDSKLTQSEQKKLTHKKLQCIRFPDTICDVPLYELRLILGSQNTQEDHTETIISPSEREALMRQLRNFIDGATIYGQTLTLSPSPFATADLEGGFVLPPAICVKGQNNKQVIIPAPIAISEVTLKERTRKRSQHIRQNGFLIQRPINPLLAYPRKAGKDSAERIQQDFNYLLEQQGIDYRFSMRGFDTVDKIRRTIEEEGYDSAVVVLPPNNNERVDLHEQVKQRLEVPSQCIMLKNIMPKKIECSLQELKQRDNRLARRIEQRYEMVILNLLVKHHWLPFLPIEGFNFNVQVGLDVGGQHNTKAVSCLGYGFNNPKETLIFRPDAIPIDVQKAEPIPTQSLFNGLLGQFEVVYSELINSGLKADFERVLFLRDGHLSGDVDKSWNETDALLELHTELLKRGWITENSIWTAVEVRKMAEEWRLLRNTGKVDNPLAGRYVFPYDNDDIVLVCTTGAQYLSQGTANPTMLQIIDLFGRADRKEIIQDVVWGADMCFTKPDVGMRLPWVLHVADAGALQLAKSYKVTGITV